MSYKMCSVLGIHSSGAGFGIIIYWPDKNKSKDETVNAKAYLKLLQKEVIPDLKALNPVNPGILDGVYFQQDGAAPHRAQTAKTYLKEQFGDRILGLGLPGIGWPPYSPDLTPCDFWYALISSASYICICISSL